MLLGDLGTPVLPAPLRQPEFIASIDTLMRRFFVLHARMQQFFRAWDLADTGVYSHAAMNVVDVEFLRRLQASLGDAIMDDEPLRQARSELRAPRNVRAHMAGHRRRAPPELPRLLPPRSPRRGCSTSAPCG